MRAFITGTTGFVGRHLREHLLAEGDAVLGSHRGRTAQTDAPASGDDSAPLTWDVALGPPSHEVRRRIETFAPDVLYHLAAVSVPRDCGLDEPTPAAVQTNVEGVRHVLEFVRSLAHRPRVVFLSSSHVYAPAAPAQRLIPESHPTVPRSAYGRTKLAAEAVCREFQARDGLDVVVVRSFTQSGPGQDVRLMLAEWVEQFVCGDAVQAEVVSLDVSIDFLDVRDAVRALRAIALHGAAGGVYNLGSGIPRTTGEIFELLRRQTDDRRAVHELRPGRRSDPIADVKSLQALTGWSPRIPPAQTVADVLADRRKRS